jgi:transcriptional regulator
MLTQSKQNVLTICGSSAHHSAMKISQAIRKAGSQAALARLVRCTRANVSIWLRRGRQDLPDLYLYRLKEARPEWFK